MNNLQLFPNNADSIQLNSIQLNSIQFDPIDVDLLHVDPLRREVDPLQLDLTPEQVRYERSRRMHAFFTSLNLLLCLVIVWLLIFGINNALSSQAAEESLIFQSTEAELSTTTTVAAPQALPITQPALEAARPEANEAAFDAAPSKASAADMASVLSR